MPEPVSKSVPSPQLIEARRRVTGWTILLIIAMGLVTVYSLLQPPTLAELSLRPELTSNLADAGSLNGVAASTRQRDPSPARAPAAVADKSIKFEYASRVLDQKNLHQALDLKLPCEKRRLASEAPTAIELSNGVTQIRFTGTACMKKSELTSTEIVNESNGFSATVFSLSKNSFTTDYISLAPGSNVIKVIHFFKTGGREVLSYKLDRSL